MSGTTHGAGDGEETWGWELLLDLEDCDLDAISSGEHIRNFAIRLCDDIIDMRRYGDPIVERFGLEDPKTAGYSLVQLIETSSIVAHFSELRRTIYLDVFSCAPYDREKVEAFACEHFGGRVGKAHFIARG